MGREEERKRALAMDASRAFGAAVRDGLVSALDRFGQPITAGTLVLYRSNVDVVFQVLDVKPVLDPRVPTGAVTLVLAVEIPLTVPVRQPIVTLVKIGARPVGQEAAGVTSDLTPVAAAEAGPEAAPGPPLVLSDVDPRD